MLPASSQTIPVESALALKAENPVADGRSDCPVFTAPNTVQALFLTGYARFSNQLRFPVQASWSPGPAGGFA
jgi:hypothetical protein